MMHFAQAGIALVVAGASILIVAGLVREGLHGGGRHLHLFPEDDAPELPDVRLSETSTTDDAALFAEAQDDPELPRMDPAEAVTPNLAGPFPHSRGSARGSKKDSSVEDRRARKQRKEKRCNKKRNGTDGRTDTPDCGMAVEAENA